MLQESKSCQNATIPLSQRRKRSPVNGAENGVSEDGAKAGARFLKPSSILALKTKSENENELEKIRKADK